MLHIKLQSADFCFHLNQRPLYLQHLVKNGLIAAQLLVLRQVSQCLSLGNDDLSIIGGQLSDDDF